MEISPPTFISPLLLRDIFTSIFIFADRSVLTLSQKYKLLHILRCLLVSTFLFLLSLLPSLPPSKENFNPAKPKGPKPSSKASVSYASTGGGGCDSGIARALAHLLSIVNDIPVSSRKYELVRSLAETIIDENHQEGSEVLREVNRGVLLAAFARTLSQLEAAVEDGGSDSAENGGGDGWKVRKVWRAVRYFGDVAWTPFGKARAFEPGRTSESAEKLAAEVLWLARKMAACGCVEEAVGKWASATNLAWLVHSAEPRLQGWLVKVSAYLFKQAKDLGLDKDEEVNREQEIRKTKMEMLMSWLPFLCQASNGTDSPVLSIRERAELEGALGEMIEALEEEEQEKVLSLWLHHFTLCPSADWPNLHSSYARWCTASRKLLLLCT